MGGTTYGVAPCSNIFGIKAMDNTGSGAYSDIISGLEFVRLRHVAKVYSESLFGMFRM